VEFDLIVVRKKFKRVKGNEKLHRKGTLLAKIRTLLCRYQQAPNPG